MIESQSEIILICKVTSRICSHTRKTAAPSFLATDIAYFALFVTSSSVTPGVIKS